MSSLGRPCLVVLLVVLVSVSEVTSQWGLGPGGFPLPLTLLASLGPNTEELSRVQRIAFRPETGLKNRAKFEEKHGPRGERLVAMFGQGVAPGPASITDDHLIFRNNLLLKKQRKQLERESKRTSSVSTTSVTAASQ